MSILGHKWNFNKKCPLLLETPTSSRKAHFIKNRPLHQKTTFFDKVPFFDEFRFSSTSFTSYHVELEQVTPF